MRVRDSAGKILNIRLSLGTSVKLASTWGYLYKFANKGDDVSLEWAPLKVKAFEVAVKGMVPTWNSGTPLPLNPGTDIDVRFKAQEPQLIVFPVALFDKHGKRIATALAPAYIPTTK
jgi:hypothetical protein